MIFGRYRSLETAIHMYGVVLKKNIEFIYS